MGARHEKAFHPSARWRLHCNHSSIQPRRSRRHRAAVAAHLSVQIADGLLTAVEAKTNAVALAGDDTLLSESQAAEILATRRGTLAHWRQIGHGPRIVKISPNRLAYRLGDLRSFIESAARGPKVPGTVALAALDSRR